MVDGHLIELSEDTFDSEVLGSDLPVLVLFGADWCSPCRRISPMLTEVADALDDRVKVASVDIDQNTALRDRFQISAIPTALVFRKGEVIRKLIGVMSKAELISAADEAVSV